MYGLEMTNTMCISNCASKNAKFIFLALSAMCVMRGFFLISRGKKVLLNAIFEQKSNLPNNPKMSVIFLGFCKKGRGSAFLVSTNPFQSCRVVAMCTFRVRGSKCKVVYQGNK